MVVGMNRLRRGGEWDCLVVDLGRGEDRVYLVDRDRGDEWKRMGGGRYVYFEGSWTVNI